MARVSTYLNFPGTTEQAFQFYKSVFQTEFLMPIKRFHEIPAMPGQPAFPESMQNLVLHVELPILGGHVLMATDCAESMGQKVIHGNNMSINLEPDTRTETDLLFRALSEGGEVEMAPQEMFWGGYFASLTDRFGIRWMMNCYSKT